MKKAKLMDASPKTVMPRIRQFLYLYRNTPHQTTKATPAQLLMGRNLRTHLSLLLPDRQDMIQDHQEDRMTTLQRDTSVMQEGTQVLARDYRQGKPPWISGIVAQENYGTKTIQTADGNVNRHNDQLLPTRRSIPVPIITCHTPLQGSPTRSPGPQAAPTPMLAPTGSGAAMVPTASLPRPTAPPPPTPAPDMTPRARPRRERRQPDRYRP